MKYQELEAVARAVRGRRVVLANGCFDILHAGHVRYLDGAKRLGETLVVAVNDDASVRRLKGPGRPILDLEERVSLVSALRSVDYVVSFPGADVSAVIEKLRPAVHAKGTDYTEDTVPEREYVRKHGGQVAIVGDPKDHSTTDVLTKILGRSPSDPRGDSFGWPDAGEGC